MLSVVWFKLFQEQFVFKGHIIPSKREVCIKYKASVVVVLNI